MKIINAIKWFTTWLSLWMLKRSLGQRLLFEPALWLQPVVSNKPVLLNRLDFMLKHCLNKRVLHIGFTDHPFTAQKIKDNSLLHLQLKQIVNSLAGLDVEESAIREYIALTGDERVFAGNIMEAYPPRVIEFEPEIILLSEVLEHLTDPYEAIKILHKDFPAGTDILVTVPNYTSLDNLAASLHKTESIHPHHHWYFSPYTLRQLLDDKRFELKQLHFGMYYQPKSTINFVLKNYPFNGDCIMAIFTIIKSHQHD